MTLKPSDDFKASEIKQSVASLLRHVYAYGSYLHGKALRLGSRIGIGFLLPLAAFLLVACAARPTGLLRPNGVAVAPDGTLYVMDRGNYRVVHLSATGEFLGAFGRLGTTPESIYKGWDVGVDAAGNIYICNMVYSDDGSVLLHDGVKVFTPDGRLLREVGEQDYDYNDTTTFRHSPYGLDLDAEGRVYVANIGTNTVRVFDKEGRLLARFFGKYGHGEDEFSDLVDVAVDEQRNLLYAVDNINGRVQQYHLAFAASGEPVVTHRLALGYYGREPGQFSYPQTVAVEQRSGRVYVGDMGNLRIQVFDPDGTYLVEFTPPDTENWQVMGLAVGEDGAVYAADALNNVIWVFESDGRLRRRIEVQ